MAQKTTSIAMGLESSAGTLVAATHKWDGEGEVEFLDSVEQPSYLTGEAGATVEDAFIGGTGTRLNLKDTPCSFQQLAYLLNMAIKAIAGPATAFDFTFPTTAVNTLSTFTWEYAVLGQVTQEYEFGYGFCPQFNFHADAKANNGVAYVNAVIEGRKAAPSTATASMAFIPAREMMNMRTASFKLDALGTAAGTAAATTGTLRGFSCEVKTGHAAGFYSDSRADKDFAVIDGGGIGYEITGKLRCNLNSNAITQLANARSATGKVLQVDFIGTSTLDCKFKLPLLWTSAPKIGDQADDGLWFAEFDYKAGYSRTTTAQGPSINITLASTTIT